MLPLCNEINLTVYTLVNVHKLVKEQEKQTYYCSEDLFIHYAAKFYG